MIVLSNCSSIHGFSLITPGTCKHASSRIDDRNHSAANDLAWWEQDDMENMGLRSLIARIETSDATPDASTVLWFPFAHFYVHVFSMINLRNWYATSLFERAMAKFLYRCGWRSKCSHSLLNWLCVLCSLFYLNDWTMACANQSKWWRCALPWCLDGLFQPRN